MRRYHAVHRHQRGTQRNSQLQQRSIGFFGDGECQRDQQHHPDFDKQGNAADQADQHHNHVRRQPAAALERQADALRRAGDLHHLAENGAETDHRRQEAQRTADPALNGVDHLQRAHSHHRPDEKARQQQRQKRMKLQFDDG